MQDGISATVESFSQLANGLAYLRQQDFSKASKAELLLGSGKGGINCFILSVYLF